SAGGELGSVAPNGEGPGEFRLRSLGGVVGDTLWVSDPMLRRTTMFRADGSLLRTTRWASTVESAGESFGAGFGVQPDWIDSDGSYLTTLYRGNRTSVPGWWKPDSASEMLIRVDEAGNLLKVLAGLNTDSRCIVLFRARGSTNPGTFFSPFCAPMRRSVSAESQRIVTVMPRGAPGRYNVTVRSFDGYSVYSSDCALPGVRVTRAMRDRAIAEIRDHPRPPAVQAAIEPELRRVRIPAVLPSVLDLQVGSDGST